MTARSRRFHELTVAAVERLTDDAAAVTFDVPDDLRDDFAFAAGQSLTLRRYVDGVEHRRSYSICAPVGATPRVGVREIPDGLFSHWLVHEVRPGDVVEVQTPTGSFRADPAEGGRHLCIAAGSGITPMLSIASTVLTNPDAPVTLLYGNRTSGLGDVRRGARRPEEPATAPGSSSCTCCRASPATSSCSPAGSTPTGCAGCSRRWCRSTRRRPRVAVRAVRHDRRRARGARRARRADGARALRAVLRRRAAARAAPRRRRRRGRHQRGHRRARRPHDHRRRCPRRQSDPRRRRRPPAPTCRSPARAASAAPAAPRSPPARSTCAATTRSTTTRSSAASC